ncbi:hypothetical protein ACN38_g7065 [Penicillium nordicum]|uniref:Uncharacterized protein n=1 Tax=Penicillium nordicum TaxID=229535 RepID=A0A0N0RYL1_9EURO|nr:hypothetical protein ACN38_g7065 [Penicillium nordicum]
MRCFNNNIDKPKNLGHSCVICRKTSHISNLSRSSSPLFSSSEASDNTIILPSLHLFFDLVKGFHSSSCSSFLQLVGSFL